MQQTQVVVWTKKHNTNRLTAASDRSLQQFMRSLTAVGSCLRWRSSGAQGTQCTGAPGATHFWNGWFIHWPYRTLPLRSIPSSVTWIMSSTTHCAKCLLASAGDTSANPQDGRAGAGPLDALCIGDLNGSIAKILCCGVFSAPPVGEPSMPRSNDGGSTPRSAHQKTPSLMSANCNHFTS